VTPPTLATAKVFMTGRSQAVRLPKDYRFNTKEVTIERQGSAVILRPVDASHDEWFARLVEVCGKFEGIDFIGRERKPLTDEGMASFD
jgi:antitoxin VapB